MKIRARTITSRQVYGVTLTAEEATLLYDLAVGEFANLDPRAVSKRFNNQWLYELGRELGRP